MGKFPKTIKKSSVLEGGGYAAL